MHFLPHKTFVKMYNEETNVFCYNCLRKSYHIIEIFAVTLLRL